MLLWIIGILPLKGQKPSALDSTTIAALSARARAYNSSGQNERALEVLKQAIQLAAPYPEWHVDLQREQVSIYLQELQFDAALNLAFQTLEESKRVQGADAVVQVQLYGLIGQAHARKGDLKKGIKYFKKGLDMASRLGQDELKPRLLNGLGVIHNLLGESEEALVYYKEVERYYQTTDQQEKLSQIYNNMASLYAGLTDWEEAIGYMRKVVALEEQQEEKNWYRLIRAYRNMAILHREIDQPHKSLELIQLAQALVHKELNSNPNQLLDCMAAEAGVYNYLNNTPKAIQILEREKALRDSLTTNKSDFKRVQVHLNLTAMYISNKNYAKAKIMAEQIFDDCQHPMHRARVNDILSVATYQLGERQASQEYIKTALELYRSADEPVIESVSDVYARYANWAWEEGAPMDSVDAYVEKAARVFLMDNNRSIQENIKAHNYANESHMIHRFAAHVSRYLERYKKDPQSHYLERAAIYLAYAKQLVEQQETWGIKEEDKRQSRSVELPIYEEEVALHYLRQQHNEQAANHQAAFRAMETNKAHVLSANLKGRYAQRIGGVPDSLLTRQKTLQQAIQQGYKERVDAQDQSPKARAAIDLALASNKRALQTLEQRFRNEYPAYGQWMQGDVSPDLAHVQQTVLNAHTALIEFLVTDSTIYQLVVTQQATQLYDLHVSKATLDRYVRRFRKALTKSRYIQDRPQQAYALFHETGQWLYQNLMAQALAPLTGIDQLIIIPDYTLGHLPFEVFVVTPQEETNNYQTIDYLLQHYAVRYSYSAQLLMHPTTPSPSSLGTKGLLAIASSYSEVDSVGMGQRSLQQQVLRSHLQALPAALKEVEVLTQLYADGQAWQNTEANEQAFKQHAKEYNILHLAMHGLVNTRHPMLSAMVFTETGDSLEDNFLYAYEIAQMDLQAKLVVLSACETGYGKFEQGEGVLSLARSFMQAGVPSALVSLWKVNDYSTAAIMERFYRHLKAGKPTAEALRLAKQSYLAETSAHIAHPMYWAAFVAIGQDTVVTPVTPWTTWLAWLGAGLLLSMLGYSGWRRYRGW